MSVSDLTAEQEVRMLSSSQRAATRRGIRAALAAASPAALIEACDKYEKLYGIGYESIRLILNGE